MLKQKQIMKLLKLISSLLNSILPIISKSSKEEPTSPTSPTSKKTADCIVTYHLINKADKSATGLLSFRKNNFKIISGKFGRGFAPKGQYLAYGDQLQLSKNKSYSQYGYGWYLPIEPQFTTDRTGLMIHPDGNIRGTLGCIGLDFGSLKENIQCYKLFKDYFNQHNILEIEIC